jgi:prohead serine protease
VTGHVLDGRVVLYRVPHEFRGQTDIFEAGCFAGSLDMVFMGVDHKYNEKPLGRTEDGSLELHDDDVALSFRLKLSAGAQQRLDGRSEASAAYVVRESEIRKDIRHIKSAILFEISACHIATMRGTHCSVRDARTVRTLAHDAKNNFACHAAETKFIEALRRLDNSLPTKL